MQNVFRPYYFQNVFATIQALLLKDVGHYLGYGVFLELHMNSKFSSDIMALRMINKIINVMNTQYLKEPLQYAILKKQCKKAPDSSFYCVFARAAITRRLGSNGCHCTLPLLTTAWQRDIHVSAVAVCLWHTLMGICFDAFRVFLLLSLSSLFSFCHGLAGLTDRDGWGDGVHACMQTVSEVNPELTIIDPREKY